MAGILDWFGYGSQPPGMVPGPGSMGILASGGPPPALASTGPMVPRPASMGILASSADPSSMGLLNNPAAGSTFGTGSMPPASVPPVPSGADSMARADVEPDDQDGRKPVPGSSFFGRLSQMVGEHPLTLMALGAGLAGSRSIGEGISRGLTGATQGMGADIQRQMLFAGQSAQYKNWRSGGATHEQALAGLFNADAAKKNDEVFGPQQPKIIQIKDPDTGIEHSVVQMGANFSLLDPNGMPRNIPMVHSTGDILKLPPGTPFITPDMRRIRTAPGRPQQSAPPGIQPQLPGAPQGQ